MPEVRDTIRGQIVRRLVPAIERFFQFSATRMDRYIVACYDSAIGGHFHRHRDNVNVGAQHRRFAVTINLNNDYDGCDLIFPEFGRRTYRAPHGGAVVFSCGALHQVTPVTRGKRYAFLAFLYGEADAALAREKRLQDRAKRIPLQRRDVGPAVPGRGRTPARAPRRLTTRTIRTCHCFDVPGNIATLLGMESPVTADTSDDLSADDSYRTLWRR